MRTSTKSVTTLAAVLAAAAISCLPRSGAAAPSLGDLTPSEGPLRNAAFTLTGTEIPFRMKVTLVESGVDAPRKIKTRIRRHSDVEIVGDVRGKLTADRQYDVVVTPRDGSDPLVLAAAFTARAPQFTALDTLSAAPGEQSVATVDFASKRTRFRVAGKRARGIEDGTLDGHTFRFLVPGRLPAGTTDATVEAQDGRVKLDAPQTLGILADRRKVAARVGTSRFTSWQQGFDQEGGTLVLTGGMALVRGGRSHEAFLTLRVPLDLATADLPVTLTQADGATAEWISTGGGVPGPTGRYGDGACSVTVEYFDGVTLFGRFDARLRDLTSIDGRRRDLEIPSGTFAVDRNP